MIFIPWRPHSAVKSRESMRWCLAAVVSALVSGQTLQPVNGVVTVPGACTLETAQTLALPCSASDPCPLFLELADVESAGNRLIVTGNIHTGSTTIESVLLASDDAGQTWREAHPRIPSAVLDQVQFLDFEHGWISGHLLQAVPRDAFLLVSTDGGKTWRRRPVSGESRTGAIEQFWFDSRTHGTLTLDRVRAAENGLRYEIWESMTGGESWSIRQVNSQPLRIERPPRERLWRIRADSTRKVHRLEKRDGGRWTPVAAFSVSAGECKPAEPESAEPPPPSAATSAEPVESRNPAAAPTKPPSLRKPRN